MEKIFYIRGNGRKTKSLTVYISDGEYHFHFFILGRTNPSRNERKKGAREKRFIILDSVFCVNVDSEIHSCEFPLPDLVDKFISFLKCSN